MVVIVYWYISYQAGIPICQKKRTATGTILFIFQYIFQLLYKVFELGCLYTNGVSLVIGNNQLPVLLNCLFSQTGKHAY